MRPRTIWTALLMSPCVAAAFLGSSGLAPGAKVDPGVCGQKATRHYEPTGASLAEHPLPDWFSDAKLGIFVHWGLYSVPAFAPVGKSFKTRKKIKREEFNRANPYAEWYFNTMLNNESETAEYHRQHYGENPSEVSYFRNFVPRFNDASARWNPREWAQVFKAAGAKYVVLTTKHHDSFCLWPTKLVNPYRPEWGQHAKRDIVGDLTAAVRAEGMEMGLYYSGGFDWSFHKGDTHVPGFREFITDPRFTDLAYAHLQELIDSYRPAILWDDIGWPRTSEELTRKVSPARLLRTFADYFNHQCPQGAVNNRWDAKGKFKGDFGTPEYDEYEEVQKRTFETCRGIGESFGYNAQEGKDQYMTPGAAIELLVNTVAQNGRLLLDVGPKADGTIPELQLKVLRAMGDWMRVNGEALDGAVPLLRPGSKVTDGDSRSVRVRYTQKHNRVYAIFLDHPPEVAFSLRQELMDAGRVRSAALLAGSGAHSLQLGSGGGAAAWVPRQPGFKPAVEGPVVLRLTIHPGDPILDTARYFTKGGAVPGA